MGENNGEAVVISGMSGLYPKSNNVKEFSEILYNKINPISTADCRWQTNHPEASPYIGVVPGLNRFDAQFFKVYYKLGKSMDPMSKKILEHCFQALYDAGVGPDDIYGKKVAVYVGPGISETDKASYYASSAISGVNIAGCGKTMFANRISYWLNLKGPSIAIDQACCGSSCALTLGYEAITRENCEAAIVAGSNLFLHPQTSIQLGRIINNCPDGKTKCFDEKADGCCKSEAIQVLFLQKAKDALRIYAEVVHIQNSYVNAYENGTYAGLYRNPAVFSNFLKEFYDGIKISPKAVEYVEANAAALAEEDKAELEAISNVFCKDRSSPLLVGSVMSNIGYTGAASGLCAVVKALIAYKTGKIPGNLHLSNPRKDIPALQDGKIRIVTENEPFGRGYVAINNHSFTGCTTHILLKGRYKSKDTSRFKSSIPYLVNISARQESAVQKIFDDLKSRPMDPEELALFHNIHKSSISGHLARGFTILDTDSNQNTVCLKETTQYFDNARRPLWFVYSGMGSQWPGMGIQLMRIPIFAAAIERCQRVLKPKGIDVVHIITSEDKSIFDNILHSFVGIVAMQIGLTDVLRELGLVPDKIIGHSLGELSCAYADGCFTADETILCAYSRGLVSIQTPFIKGSMVAVGMGYEQIKGILPPEIEVACHNSAESSTISGPADVMKEFVSSLVAKGIFAKQVPSSNIAYHSRYIAEAGPKLRESMMEIIKEPRERSERWVSTSVPQEMWDSPIAKTSSAEYHTNNLLHPVLFEEACTLIPDDAVLLEVAAHGLLQAILKRSLPGSCKYIPLTRRDHADNTLMVLEAVGKLFMEGYNTEIDVLYPKIEFPVSTETPMLSHLVEWAHDEEWYFYGYAGAQKGRAAAANYIICLLDPEYNYLKGNVVRGKNVYPFAAALEAVWETLAMYTNTAKNQFSVTFHDVELLAEPILSVRPLKINVSIHKGRGYFEVLQENSKVATGYIKSGTIENTKILQINKNLMIFNNNVIYQILHERDYSYGGAFRSIHAVNESFTEAQIIWDENWVTLIDAMIQMNILQQNHHAVSKPLRIRKLAIDTEEHQYATTTSSMGKVILEACIDELLDTTRCGGITMESIRFKSLPLYQSNVADIKSLQFTPYFSSSPSNFQTAVAVCLQIVAENVNKTLLNIVEIVNNAENTACFRDVVEENDVPDLRINYKQHDMKEMTREQLSNVDLVLVQGLSMDNNLCNDLYSMLKTNVLILNTEKNNKTYRARPSTLFRIVATQNAGDVTLSLGKWRPNTEISTRVVTVRKQSDLSLLLIERHSMHPNDKLLVLTSYPPVSGVRDLIDNWRKEPERNKINLAMFNPSNNGEEKNTMELPKTELAVNIQHKGVWGGEYFLPLRYIPPAPSSNVTLRSKNIGELKSFSWIEAPEPTASGISVKVYYAGLNTVDVIKAAGVYKMKEGNDVDDISYGMDFSGVTGNGVRVMGLIESGAASHRVTANENLLWPIPNHWTLEDAATVPMPYALAFYCLAIKTQMLRNYSILVHGGAGALGQAIISIALAHGLQVFTTVSDMQKKHFLKKLFPVLKEDHIGNSRDSTFRDMINITTNGMGVTYVINTLKGELKEITNKCTGSCGAVIDVSQIPSGEVYSFPMENLSLERTYSRVDFSSIFQNNADMIKLQYLISEGISQGYVRPLSRVIYDPSEVSRAFRLLETSQHRGRVLLTLNTTTPNAQPRITCSHDLTHVVICDGKTLGLQIADRLVKRGARKLLLQLTTLTPQVLYKKRLWQEVGAAVNVYTNHLDTKINIEEMLIVSSNMGAVEGIYYITTEKDVKRDTLNHIDTMSQKLCPSLRNFAIVSIDDKFGHDLCIARIQQQLPATKICLSSFKKADETYMKPSESINSWIVCDAFECALRSNQTFTKVQLRKSRKALLWKIANIADVNLPGVVKDENTLKDLGIHIDRVQSIEALLREEYNQVLGEETILELTVEKIRELEQNANGKARKIAKGFEMFFTHFDSDELISTTDIMLLPTKTDDTLLKLDDFDPTKSYLCIMPGMEGHYERFRTLCERLKMPALVVQPDPDIFGDIKRMAARNAQLLLKKLTIKNNFYLMGYESGVLITLEIAAILEEYGLTGTIYLIGGAADHLKNIIKAVTQQYGNEHELQKAVLRYMYKLISNKELSLDIDEGIEWDEFIELCVRELLKHVPLSAEYAKLNFKIPYYRIKEVLEYEPQLPPLKSKLVLLQPSDMEGDEVSSALQKYTVQPLVVHNLSLPLSQALEDLHSAVFVNQHLDANILEIFKNTNLCVTYPMRSDDFKETVDKS